MNIIGFTVGELTSSPAYPDSPDSVSEITSIETPTDFADAYGQRLRGWIHAPVTGQYRFWIAGDDESQLWLSTNDSPAGSVLIANVPLGQWTASREWTKFPSQTSTLINLMAGQRYYIEVLHKDAGGPDNLAVGWQIPGSSVTTVVDGQYLSPWPVNRAPTLTNPGALGSVVGVAASIQLIAADADNDPLVFNASGLPPLLVLEAAAPHGAGAEANPCRPRRARRRRLGVHDLHRPCGGAADHDVSDPARARQTPLRRHQHGLLHARQPAQARPLRHLLAGRPDAAMAALMLAPVIPLSVMLGIRLHRHLSQDAILIVTNTLLVLGGIRLLHVSLKAILA